MHAPQTAMLLALQTCTRLTTNLFAVTATAAAHILQSPTLLLKPFEAQIGASNFIVRTGLHLGKGRASAAVGQGATDQFSAHEQ